MSRITKRYGSLRVDDGGTFFYVFADIGDFKVDGIQESNADAVPVYERDQFVTNVYGQEKPLTGSFTCNVPREEWTHATNKRLFDVLVKAGSASGATTTNPGAFGPMTFTGKYTLSAGGTGGSITLPNFRIAGSYDESGDVVKLSITFQAHTRTIAA